MRCLGCKAWKDGKCLAGVTPYRSKNERDGTGCACNTRTVEKLMRQNRKTNADRIRAMSDEELGELLEAFTYNVTTCPKEKCHLDAVSIFEPLDREACKKCWLDWLRQEGE